MENKDRSNPNVAGSESLASSRASAPEKEKPPKKRRKVTTACVYCRRSHMTCDLGRPCKRCQQRDIGHLCHDEARDSDSRKSRSIIGAPTEDESESHLALGMGRGPGGQAVCSMGPPSSFDAGGLSVASGSGQATQAPFDASALGHGNPNPLQLVQPTPVAGIQANVSSRNIDQLAGFPDSWMTTQNPFQDMHNYTPNYMFTPEVTNEFRLLNDFLHSSLLDDGALLSDDQNMLLGNQPDAVPGNLSLFNSSGDALLQPNNNHLLPPSSMQSGSMPPPPLATGTAGSNADKGKGISRPSSVMAIDKTSNGRYWLQVADPDGNDTPEVRMKKLLQAKSDAGLLKPFNYVKGYARLSTYLEGHVAPASRQKISRQLDRFRPKFREQMHALTDMDLIFVEMWFEQSLMSYDRVFAAMAMPACCWRRTGEIVRGNKEFAELINVPVESLRDGKWALHEILTEESVVRYWEEFGTIAFDPAHDTLLTTCTLKCPDEKQDRPTLLCCFSIKIRRDDHKIPSLIVGNFLPHDPDANNS